MASSSVEMDTDGDDDEFDSDYEYASSEYSIDDDVYPTELLEQQHSLFNQEPVSCPICCEERVEEGGALILPACSHSFCVECFTRYLEVQIGQGNADNIICPFICAAAASSGSDTLSIGKQCNAPVGMDVLHEIMTPEKYERLMQQKESAFVRKNADYHHCITPDCTNIVLCKIVNDDGARICDCFKCGHTSCLTCGARPFHVGKTCEDWREERTRKKAAHLRTVARNQQQFGSYLARPDPDRTRASEETKYDFEFGSVDTDNDPDGFGNALQNVKRCRRCGNGVELLEGCLKMKCICGYRFCYQCGSENALCGCTPRHHGFTDNQTGHGDFSGLAGTKSYT